MARTIWSAKDTEEESSLPSVQAVLASVSRLAEATTWFPVPALTEVVTGGGPLSPVDEAGITAWFVRIRKARAFEEKALIRPDDWRPTYLESAIQLAATAPPDEPTKLVFRSSLLGDVIGLVSGVTGDSPVRLFEALASAASLTASDRCLARASLVATATSVPDRSAFALLAQEFIGAYDLETDEADRSILAEAIGAWLSGTMPSVEEAWTVLDRYVYEPLPEALRSGLSDYAGGISSEQRTALSKATFEAFPDRMASEELLETIQFHNGTLPEEVDLIVGLFGRATNEDHRRGIMRLWNALRLTNHDLIRRLLNDVMVPLVNSGKTSREIVMQNLHLVQALSKKEKRGLAEKFQRATQSEDDEWDSVSRRLVEAGFMKQGGIFLARHPEHLD